MSNEKPTAISIREKTERSANRIMTAIGNHPLITLILMMLVSFAVIYFPFIFKGEVFIYSDIGADTENVYYPFFSLMFDKIKNLDFSFWTFEYGLGTSILSRQADTFSIFTYLLFIFGKENIKYSLIYVHMFKMLISGIIAYKYLSCFSYGNTAKVIAAYLYAFNGFVMLWGQHYFFSTASVCIILIFLAIEKVLKSDKYPLCLIFAIACVLIFSYYIAYMSLIISAIYLLFRIVYISFTEKKIPLKKIGFTAVSYIFAFLVSAFAFFPSVTVLFQLSERASLNESLFTIIKNNIFTHTSRSTFLTGILRVFSNNLLGIEEYCGEKNYYEAPQYFMSSLNVFVFMLLFFEAVFNFKKEKTKSVCVFVAEAAVLYSAVFKLIPVMFNGFTSPIYRYTFVLIPIFAFGYAEVFDKILSDKLTHKKFEVTVSAVISVGLLSLTYFLKGSRSAPAVEMLLVCLFTVFVTAILSVFYNKNELGRIGAAVCSVTLAFTLIFNVCCEGYVTSQKRDVASIVAPERYTGHESDSVLKVISMLEEEDDSFYRTEKSFYTVSCLCADSMVQGYNGISAYDSVENKYVLEFVKKVCPEMVFGPATHYHCFNNVKHNETIVSVLGVKYVISTSPDEYDGTEGFYLYKTVDDLYIYKNINADSIARMYYDTADEPENFPESNIDLMNTLVLNGQTDKKYSSERKSEKISTIYKDKNNSSRVYGTVEADEDGYLFLSIPYSEAWTAYVDGKPADTIRADYGFTALKVGEGKHDIELKYETPLIYVSAAVSAFALLGLAVFSIIRSLKRKKKKEKARFV